VGAEMILDPQWKDLQAKRIAFLHGRTALRLDTGRQVVEFDGGEEKAYDLLLVATGGKPAVFPALATGHAAIRIFDSYRDALAIRERASLPGNAVVYGPGYLAIEACRALRKAKREVIWIQPDLPRPGYPISGELEASILDEVRNRGAAIREGEEIVQVREKDADTCIVVTRTGEEISCSLLVVATERVPSVGFLSGSGVMVKRGVLVDEFLRTSVADVYAAGDCAEFVGSGSQGGSGRINFGWRSAILQGHLAGENMAGGSKRFGGHEEDYFWALFGFPLLDRVKR
jgi:NADPH-dependent 2,4-dienoyl-CoA reductase/sulfur reductase-like enzyme